MKTKWIILKTQEELEDFDTTINPDLPGFIGISKIDCSLRYINADMIKEIVPDEDDLNDYIGSKEWSM